MTHDEAFAWARSVAPVKATKHEVRIIAGALLDAERKARQRALAQVAEEIEMITRSEAAGAPEMLMRRLRGMADAAKEGRE